MQEESLEYLQNETERSLLETIEEFEVTTAGHPFHKKADWNHIFINFLATIIVDPKKLEESLTGIFARYGSRLMKLRVLQAELKMVIRASLQSPPQTIRVCFANDSGYSLDVVVYTEVFDRQSGEVKQNKQKTYVQNF